MDCFDRGSIPEATLQSTLLPQAAAAEHMIEATLCGTRVQMPASALGVMVSQKDKVQLQSVCKQWGEALRTPSM